MAVRDELLLDLSKAIAQIDDLERQLDSLLQPVTIPVTLDDSQVTATSLSKAEQVTQELEQELGLTDDRLNELKRDAPRTGKELEDAGKQGTKAFSGLKTSLEGAAIALAGFVSARAIINFFRDSISATSDLAESTSKAEVVFGRFFDDIQEFASTAPQALGLANQQALEFTATFGNLFTALGLTQQQAADLSPQIVQLGADLASFNNIEVTDALDKLRAGLVGESEPLRTLGVNLTAANVAAKAVALGLADSVSSVSEAAKVQARYALILEQTGTAQGDFARTAEGTANQIRTFNAGIEQLKAEVGEALIPALQSALDILDSFLPALSAVATEFAVITGSISESEGDLRKWSAFSGQARGSAELLAGAINQVAKESDDYNKGSGKNSQVTAEFTDRVTALVNSFTGGAQEIIKVRDNLGVLVDQFDLTQREADIVAGILDNRLSVAVAESADRALLAGSKWREATAEITSRADSLTEFGDSLSHLIPSNVSFDAQIEAISASLSKLPDTFDAAEAALRDKQGELITDFSDFLDTIDAEIAKRAEFRRNIAILHALGLDLLAETFTDVGLDAAAALADAIANPTEAAAAEAKLKANAEQQAREAVTAFGATVGAELAALEPYTFEVTPVLTALDASALNFLNLNVGVGAPGGGGGEPTVIVNINAPDVPDTTTSRVAQSVAALVRS